MNAEVTITGGNFVNLGPDCCFKVGEKPEKEDLGLNAGKLIVKGGDFKAKGAAVEIYGYSALDVTGGSFASTDDFVIKTIENKDNSSYGNITIDISGGNFEGSRATDRKIAGGIYMASEGTATLNGGTFNITGGVGVLLRRGTLNAKKMTINLAEKKDLNEGIAGTSNVAVPAGKDIVREIPGFGTTTITNETEYTVTELKTEES